MTRHSAAGWWLLLLGLLGMLGLPITHGTAGAQAPTPAAAATPAPNWPASAAPAASALVKPGSPDAAQPVPVPDTLAQRLQPCLACHGREGRASRQGYLPRIAGKPAGYLLQQLLNFRDGRRSNATMADLLANQTDAYLAEMAGHFAALDLPYPAPSNDPVPAAQLARGESLARQGDAARQLPACSDCHGPRLTGTQPAIPGLLGLPRDYLLGQLGAWRTGMRQAAGADCMATIARKLSAEDAAAVAAWLAHQPVPADAHAQPAGNSPLPLPCGPTRGRP